ncbi:MAG: hypothetical protein QOG35_701 [Solirubrobacteraceae bacterium]|nr:hypothetical protein [Solirubrobacteraceae bacterium]
MSLLAEPLLDLTAAGDRLAGLRTTYRQRAAAAALALAAGAALTALAGGGWGIPLLIGGACALFLAAISRTDRDRLLIRLVAQDDAWQLPEVRRCAARLLAPRERARLARGLLLAADAGTPGHHPYGVIRPERAHGAVEELRWLGEAVADTAVPVRASAAALGRRLLTEAALSPLYNPRLPEDDVHRLLAIMRRGIGGEVDRAY